MSSADAYPEGEALDDSAGHTVRSAGDVDGDGYADLLVGDFDGDGLADVIIGGSGWDGTATNAGVAYLVSGGALSGSLTSSIQWLGAAHPVGPISPR